MAERIELWPVDRLQPYAKNARTHSDEQIDQIAASIQAFGFTNPILVDGTDGIIAGHGRLLAAKKLNFQDVPVIVLDHLTEDQRRAYIIADNKLALNAGWDDALLAEELARLQDDGFDLALTGFSDEELADLLPRIDDDEGGTSEADEVPAVPVHPVTRPGDVWVMGRHRLMCGDSLQPDATGVLMGNGQADLAICAMAFTDPPWNIAYGDNGRRKGRAILNDNQDADSWQAFVADFAGSLSMVTRPGAPVYVVMGANEWPTVDGSLREAGFHWSSTIVWVKDQFVLTRKDYHAQYEPIWYGWNGGAARLRPVEDRTQSDVWHIPRPKVSELHPMTKPVQLIERALENSSDPGAVVVDLFGGSGSTLIACESTGRSARLMELDPKYCDVIVQRWQEFTGKTATLMGTGEPFGRRASNDNAAAAVA
jgi:DNA modification methylase